MPRPHRLTVRFVAWADIAEFCKIALEFTKKGANRKLFAKAAGKQPARYMLIACPPSPRSRGERCTGMVGASAEVVEAAVIAIAQVLITATKEQITVQEFVMSASDLPLSEEQVRVLATVRPTRSGCMSNGSATVRRAQCGCTLVQCSMLIGH